MDPSGKNFPGGSAGTPREYYRQPATTILDALDSRPSGLDPEDAARRLALHGPNAIESAIPINPLAIFFNQFKSFIIYILLFAVAFSLLIGEYVDTFIILAILVVNAAIGFFQELSAGKSLEALKKLSSTRAVVRRDNRKISIDARELVPGDIILIEAGDKVPADARLLDAVRLKVEESSLTGESLPVEKNHAVIDGPAQLGDRRNMVHASTSVATGHATAVVVATGMQTELGKITTMLQETREEMTPLQRRLDQFGRKLGYAIIAICILIFLFSTGKSVMESASLTPESILPFIFIAISLAVAAVPTALPAVVTIALSIGVKRLLHRKALVRKLSSVETLGSCDLICTDKTGTLTENQMTVRHAWDLGSEATLDGAGYGPAGIVSGSVAADLFRCGLVCNNASLQQIDGNWQAAGDPTEAALLTSAAKAGITADARRLDEIPFDSERKLMSVLVAEPAGDRIYTKGALDSVLACCSRILVNGREIPLDPEHRVRIGAQNAGYSTQAMRVLAFAMKQTNAGGITESGLTFLGLQAMIDPPRPDVANSIAKAKRAGIRIIMVTGDYGETARAIGREIGIDGEVVTGEVLEQMDGAALQQALRNGTNIFARVAPAHKQQIVEALQVMGHTVAMTGDGVNDAPALKKADIGIAVGSGTDVAKEAADFVLLDDSFTHIINAIEEGRGIYDNIQKSIMLLLSGNLGEVLIIFLAVLFGMNLPLTAILLLWINMVTDGAPALAYSVDPYGRDIMFRPPIPRDEGILPGDKIAMLGVLGSASTAIALTLFVSAGGNTGHPGKLIHAQTMVFNFIVLYEVILAFVIRRIYQVPFFSNRWVWAAAALALFLQGLLMYTPLAPVFKIVPLGPADLMMLLAAGTVFALLALAYQKITSSRKTPVMP